MPDHVDPASSVEEASGNAGNAGNAGNVDNVVSLPTDNPFSAMERSMKPQEDGEASRKRSKRLPVIMLWLVAVVIVVVDQATKHWALSALADGEHTALLGRALGLVLVRNPGAAFSFATGQTWVFALIASLVVAIIIRVSRNLASRSWAVALGLVLGGAVGNLIDRLLREPGFLRGHVIDFIDYGGYFVGNVADIAIVLAAVGIIVLRWVAGRSTARVPAPRMTRRTQDPVKRSPQAAEEPEPAGRTTDRPPRSHREPPGRQRG